MEMLGGDDDGVADLDTAGLAVEDEEALALNEGPHLAAVVVHLVGDVLAGSNGDALGEGVGAIGIMGVVEHTVDAPAALFVHGTMVDGAGIALEVLGGVFAADEDAVVAGCHDEVADAIAHDGKVQLVDDGGAAHIVAKDDVAHGGGGELFDEGVPAAELFPHAVVGNDGYGGGMLYDFVVEAVLGKLAIAVAELGEGGGLEVLRHDVHDMAETEGEDAAIPIGALGEERCGGVGIGLLHETLHAMADGLRIGRLGKDVAEAGGGAGGGDAHEDEVGNTLAYLLGYGGEGVVVAGVDIGVARHDYNDFVGGKTAIE